MKYGFILGVLLSCTPMAWAEITVSEVWAKETVPGTSSSALYATLYNTTRKPTALTKVTVEGVNKAELHVHNATDGMMQMRRVESIDVGGRATVMLEPGGYHVMLFQLKAPLKAGQKVPVEFQFSNGEKVAATANIINPNQSDAHQHHH